MRGGEKEEEVGKLNSKERGEVVRVRREAVLREEKSWVAWKWKGSETKGLEGRLGSRSGGELLIMTPLPSSCPQALTTASKPQAKPRDQGDRGGLQ